MTDQWQNVDVEEVDGVTTQRGFQIGSGRWEKAWTQIMSKQDRRGQIFVFGKSRDFPDEDKLRLVAAMQQRRIRHDMSATDIEIGIASEGVYFVWKERV